MGGGGGVRGWPDPEERCTRTPDSGSGHTPARGKAKGAGGLDPKCMEAFIKGRMSMVPVILYPRPENEIKIWLTHYFVLISNNSWAKIPLGKNLHVLHVGVLQHAARHLHQGRVVQEAS